MRQEVGTYRHDNISFVLRLYECESVWLLCVHADVAIHSISDFQKNKSGMTSQLAFLADRKEISQKAALGLRPASAKSACAAPGCVTSCAKKQVGDDFTTDIPG